jgi:predicted RNA-binding protein with RPS1 domain
MTNQERPTGEQEQARDELNVAADATPQVPETTAETSAPSSAAVDSNVTHAASDQAATETSPALETQEGDTAATSSTAPILDQAADVAPASESSDAGSVSGTSIVDQTVDADATNETNTSSALEVQAGETDAVTSTAPVADVVSAETTEAAEQTAESASYTPVAEEAEGHPRRLKDLEPGMELEGRVTSIALYGIFVDVGVGRDGLVHISEMSDTRIDSPSDIVQIGDTVKVRVKSVDPDGRRISLTMRTPEREGQARGARGRKKADIDRERLAGLRVGDTVEGTVTGIAPFGVFVDIGVGKDGLVHISELAEGRIDRAEDAVQVGQTYTFKLLEVDDAGTRISLSLRRAQRTQRMQQLEKGQIVEGTISGLAPFGAFVDIGVGRDGLVHISELAPDRVNRVEDVVNVGDKVTVRVLDVDSQSKRISLSMLLEDRPREQAPQQEERPRRDRASRPPRQDTADNEPVPSQYTVESEDDEETPANATLEDLLSKYGNGSRRDNKRRRREEDEEEDTGDRYTRRQRDAIRRTLQIGDDE